MRRLTKNFDRFLSLLVLRFDFVVLFGDDLLQTLQELFRRFFALGTFLSNLDNYYCQKFLINLFYNLFFPQFGETSLVLIENLNRLFLGSCLTLFKRSLSFFSRQKVL